MNMPVFFVTLIFLALASLLISKNASKEQGRQGYFLCDRKVGVIPLTLTFLATQLGGGAILGGAEAAYNYGWKAIYYALGISLGLFALSLGLGAKFRSMQIATIPEIFAKSYGADKLRFLSALILTVSMFFILLALGVAARKYFYTLGIDSMFWFLGFWAVIIYYTSMGGLGAVVKTDVLQVGFVLFTFAIAVLYIAFNDDGQVWQTLINLNKSPNNLPLPWSSWLLMPMLFAIIGQDMGQRCFAGRTPRVVSIATAISGLLLVLVSLFPVVLGVMAYKYNMRFDGASVLLELMQKLTNPVISSLFAVSVLMAILSTADSLLCSISSNLSYDLLPKRLAANFKFVKACTFAVGFLAMFLSFHTENIIAVMIDAYGISVCALFIPICMAALTKKPNSLGAGVAFWVGIVSFLIFKWIYKLESAEVICIGLAFLGYVLALFRNKRFVE